MIQRRNFFFRKSGSLKGKCPCNREGKFPGGTGGRLVSWVFLKDLTETRTDSVEKGMGAGTPGGTGSNRLLLTAREEEGI